MEGGIDISKNIKSIERIKCEILEDTAALYRTMNDGEDDVSEKAGRELSNIIINSILLGKRLGVSHVAIEAEIENRLKLGILNEEDPEKDFKDYSELLHYLKGRNI